MVKGNAIIGQSGGPTSVINASLAGIIDGAKEFSGISKILGMQYGVEGFLEDNIIDLGAESAEIINGLKTTPSSALGSCRKKLKEADLPHALKMLKKHDIHYVFLIGGNDTMDTIHRLEAYAMDQHYDLIGVGVPKTVDNDLFGTDHTPGFPSAAKYMALSVMQAGFLARDMKRVDQFVVFQTIGREAGWLAGATVLGKRDESDAPHIICFPERAFDREKFLTDVDRCYKKFGWVSVVCGEGICYADKTPVSASQTTDQFRNVEFGAMAGTSAAMMIHRMIADTFKFRGEFQITESLPMCAADRAVQIDIDEAYQCGRKAVELAKEGKTGYMVSIVRNSTNPYNVSFGTTSLSEVAVRAKPMPDEFISADGNYVTEKFIDFTRPLIGELPKYVRLSGIKL